jgi:Flp pilus assembly protein TadG
MLKDKFQNLTTGGRQLLKRFRNDKTGAAAIEFAFIAPLLITMYLGTMEISQGIEINKKVARSAGVIGDILGQNDDVNKNQLKDIMAIGKAMLQPYNRSEPTITISMISIDNDEVATVNWSRRGVGTTYSQPFAPGSPTTVPANLKIANTYLIRVQTQLEYLPITSWSVQKNKGSGAGAYAAIDMSEMYHLRPRVQDTVLCTDCGAPD